MGQLELLQAVAHNLVTRDGSTYAAGYWLNGEPAERMRLVWLKKRGWIEMPLSGPPVITADGVTWLRKAKPADP